MGQQIEDDVYVETKPVNVDENQKTEIVKGVEEQKPETTVIIQEK